MHKLPLLDGRRQFIAQQAHALEFAAHHSRGWPRPHTRHIGAGRARKELLRLAFLIEKLEAHISTRHRTSMDAIKAAGENPFDLLKLGAKLSWLSRAANNATAKLAKMPMPKAATKPRKRQAEIVREIAASHYEFLTGLPPYKMTVDAIKDGHPANGVWLRFLREVFKALNIDGSAEHQTRAARREKTSKK